ncbi:protein kinase [Streptomyces sp. ODS28]|uniref:serine/threonine-protein kinase n=1 Tax=Streptomyces sp. ODS28 TaxID=3136688 RepID=UPI0031EE01D4
MHTPGEHTGEPGAQGPAGDGTGRLLAGRYRVTARLGRGGMGVVWRARDERLGRDVAVKELRTFTDAGGPELADLRTRMQREARAAARVRHSGVIAVHDIDQHEGRPVIVMELIEGPSLDDLLRDRGPLGHAEAAAVGARVLDALAAAHRAGVLHRDVKPGNILLAGPDRVVLTDFGIAAVDDPDDGAATRLTASGELVGSLDYLAPEQARGEPPGPGTDVWALGATLYATVEGVSPFRRTSTWSTLTAIVSDPLPAPRRAGPLGHALAELLHKDPAHRPGAERAAALLSAVAAGTPLPHSPDTVRLGRGAGFVPGEGVGPGRGPASASSPGADSASGQAGVFGPPPVPQQAPHPATELPETGPRAGAGARADASTVGGPVAGDPLAGGPVTGDPGTGGPLGGSVGGPSGRPASGAIPGAAPGEGRRGKRRMLLAAAVAVAALAGAGTAYAVLAPDSGEHTSTPSGAPSGAPRPGGSPPDTGHRAGPAAGGCRPAGGGKHNCEVWQSVTSYDAAHKPVGTLKKGTNYFYCQAKLPQRETSDRWTNVWWAKTDDDNGNTGVFISDVYLKGGENDQPVPGLPVC